MLVELLEGDPFVLQDENPLDQGLGVLADCDAFLGENGRRNWGKEYGKGIAALNDPLVGCWDVGGLEGGLPDKQGVP